MNIYDISKKSGFSIATVSRVINGSTRVSAKTKNKVLQTMKELGYTPNAFARGLNLNTMKTIGIMCSSAARPFFSSAIDYLENGLRASGYNSVLCCTGFELENREQCLRLLLSKRVDAVMIVGSDYVTPQPEQMRYILDAANTTPIVLINAYIEHPNIICIQNNDYASIYNTVRRLLAVGKRNVYYFYKSDSRSNNEKLRGYKTALRDFGNVKSHAILLKDALDIPKTVESLLAMGRLDADAVVTSVDFLAIGFLKYANKMGIRVPEDCNVIGYDNTFIATCCEPELTCIDSHVDTLCATAVQSLMQLLESGNASKSITINGDLVIRGTTNIDFSGYQLS